MLTLALVVFSTACGFVSGGELEPMKSDRELALLAECRETSDVAQMTHKFAVCHNPGGETREPYTMLLSREAQQFHLAHGDTAGGCGCDEVGESTASPGAVEESPETSGADDETASYCDANQYSCEHNWGCPEQHICDLGCCVYVISWAESVDGTTEETTEESTSEDESDVDQPYEDEEDT